MSTPTTRRSSADTALIVALAALAGGTASLRADYLFSGTCNAYWYTECSNGVPCPNPPGGYQTFNNWGQSGCSNGLATPGPSDVAIIGNAAVTLNGNASVAGIALNPSGTLSWIAGNLVVAAPFNNPGVFSIDGGGDKVYTGVVNNTGTFQFTGSYTLWLEGGTINNAGLFNIIDKDFRPTGLGGSITNTGEIRKSGGSPDTFFNLPIRQLATMNVMAGPLGLSACDIVTAPASRFNVLEGASLGFTACTTRGLLAGLNLGDIAFGSDLRLDADTVFNFAPNPIRCNDSALRIAPGANLTNAPTGFVRFSGGGDKVIAGNVVNQGVWSFTDSYTVWLDGVIFSNSGVIEIQDKDLRPGEHPASLLNTGAINKTGGSPDSFFSLTIDHRGSLNLAAGPLYLSSCNITLSSASTETIAEGASLYFAADTLRGRIHASNRGDAGFYAMLTIDADTSFNVAPNPLRWIDSTLSVANGATLTNEPGSLLRVVGGGDKVLVGQLVNLGTLQLADGYTLWLNSGTILNSQTIELYDKDLRLGEAGSSITNTGTIAKLGGSPDSFISLPLMNQGLIRNTIGPLYLSGCSITMGPGSRFDTESGASTYFTGSAARGTLLSSNAGDMAFWSTLTIDAPTTWSVSPNPLRWTDSNLNVSPGATLTNLPGSRVRVEGGGDKVLTGSFLNQGEFTVAGGYSFFLTDAAFNNTGTFILEDKDLRAGGAAQTFSNTGTILKTGGTPDSFIGLPIAQLGSLRVQAGPLYIQGCDYFSAPASLLTVDPGAGAYFINSSLHGYFTAINQGDMAFSGTLAITDDTTMSVGPNAFRCDSGVLTINATKTLIQDQDGLMNFAGGGDRIVSGHLVNLGRLQFTNGYSVFLTDSVIDNAGSIEIYDKDLRAGGSVSAIVNTGEIRQVGGTPDSFFGLNITNSGLLSVEGSSLVIYGTPPVQTDSGITRSMTYLGFDHALNIAAGRVEGLGTIASPAFTCSGATVEPGGPSGPGTLTIASSYTQTATGVLAIRLESAGSGRLAVSGDAELAGTLRVEKPEGFSPGLNSSFPVLSARTIIGQFGVLELPPLARIEYLPGTVMVTLCAAEFNGDGDLNADDLGDFITCYFSTPPCSLVDFNHDGDVNADDLGDFITSYFSGC